MNTTDTIIDILSGGAIELGRKGEPGWATINGVHVHFGGDGTIDKGPDALKGKTAKEVGEAASSRAHESGTKAHAANAKGDHRKAAEHHREAARVHQAAAEAHDDAGEARHHRERANDHDAKAGEHESKAGKSGGKGGAMKPADWDKALDEASTRVRTMGDYNAAPDAGHEQRAAANVERNQRLNAAAAARAAANPHKPEPREERPAEPAAAHTTHTAHAVTSATKAMDAGDFTPANIDRAVAAVKALPEHDVVAGAKELGIVGADTKAKAVARIRQHLTDQAEAASKVDLIGNHRMSRDAFYLSTGTPGETTPAVTLGQGLPEFIELKVGDAVEKIPCAYLWKDGIEVGDYEHPITKQKLKVTDADIDELVDKWHAMKAAGTEFPTPLDHKPGAANNIGFMVDVKRSGTRIRALHQVRGAKNVEIAVNNLSSFAIEPDYVDGRGKRWGKCITHNAYTPTPVIPGMGHFEPAPFAASRDGEEPVPIYYLSAEQGDPEMDTKQLREALGVAADVPDDKLLDHVRTLRTTNQANAEKVATLSRAPAAPDPVILADRNESKREKIELSRDKGDMPKVVADKLLAALPADKPSAFMLSRHDGLDTTPIDFVLGLFKDARLGMPAGSQTGVQLLSRDVPGQQQKADEPLTPERVKELLNATPLGMGIVAEAAQK